MNEQYLTVLQEGLHKKNKLLDEILSISNQQSEFLAATPVSFEDFDRCVDDKDLCIEQLNKLDEGFEVLYDKVREELKGNKERYKVWIAETQKLISQVVEKSVAVQAIEKRNKQAVETALRKERESLGKGKRSAQTAMSYYRNMSGGNVASSQFMDQKK